MYRHHETNYIERELDDCVQQALGCFRFDMYRAIDNYLTQLNGEIVGVLCEEISNQLEP